MHQKATGRHPFHILPPLSDTVRVNNNYSKRSPFNPDRFFFPLSLHPVVQVLTQIHSTSSK